MVMQTSEQQSDVMAVVDRARRMKRSSRSHEHVQLKQFVMDLRARRPGGLEIRQVIEAGMTTRSIHGDGNTDDRHR